MSTPTVRVLFDQGPRLILGPLGCFEKYAKLKLARPEGIRDVIVLNIDHDGAGVAFDLTFVRRLIAERAERTGEDEKTAKGAVIKQLGESRSAPHPAVHHPDPDRIQGEMDAQCERNRREYGVHKKLVRS